MDLIPADSRATEVVARRSPRAWPSLILAIFACTLGIYSADRWGFAGPGIIDVLSSMQSVWALGAFAAGLGICEWQAPSLPMTQVVRSVILPPLPGRH